MRRASGALGLLAAGAAGLAACGAPARPDPWPAGAFVVGRRPAIAALLAQVESLAGTPLAREARRIAAALPDCSEVGALDPDGDPRALDLRCLDAAHPLAQPWRATPTPPDLLFGLPLADGSRLRGSLRTDGDDVALDLVWPGAHAKGALALVLPGAEDAGPALLAPAGRVVHLRVRPRDGLDIASLVPAGSQADRLFHLKSGLFARAVLDGTWEGAIYLPEREGGAPRVALALGFRSRGVAVEAFERFLTELRASWSVRRADFSLGAASGACLPDLNVLPELAPCYVATERALVLGWNPASLRAALDTAEPAGPAPVGPGHLEVDLSLVERADTLLVQGLPAEQRPPVADWPWQRLRAEGGLQGDDLRLRITLERAAS